MGVLVSISRPFSTGVVLRPRAAASLAHPAHLRDLRQGERRDARPAVGSLGDGVWGATVWGGGRADSRLVFAARIERPEFEWAKVISQ